MRWRHVNWIAIVAGLSVWIVVRVVLQSVSFWWTGLLAAVLLAGWLVVMARRWRERPIPRPSPYAVLAGPVVSREGERTLIPFRYGFLIFRVLFFGVFGMAMLAFAIYFWHDLGLRSGIADGLGAVFVLGGWFMLQMAFVGAVHVVRGDPGLALDADGVTIARWLGRSRRVLWREIGSVRQGSEWVNGVQHRYLAVDLSEPGDYLARHSGLNGLAERLAWRTSKDPIRISVQTLDAPDEDVLALVRHFSHGHAHTEAAEHHFAQRHRKRRRLGRRDERRPHH